MFYGGVLRVWIYKIEVSEIYQQKQFPASFRAVYWRLYRRCKQPLSYLNKNRPVFTQLGVLGRDAFIVSDHRDDVRPRNTVGSARLHVPAWIK